MYTYIHTHTRYLYILTFPPPNRDAPCTNTHQTKRTHLLEVIGWEGQKKNKTQKVFPPPPFKVNKICANQNPLEGSIENKGFFFLPAGWIIKDICQSRLSH